jgi:hypothetical protein
MKAISFTFVFSFGLLMGYSQTNSPAKATPSDKNSKTYYSLFWGLIKSKNYKPVKIQPIKIKNISLDSLDNDHEKKQVLWGAIQWTERKKKQNLKSN